MKSATLDSPECDTRLPKVRHSTPPINPAALGAQGSRGGLHKFSKDLKRSRVSARNKAIDSTPLRHLRGDGEQLNGKQT